MASSPALAPLVILARYSVCSVCALAKTGPRCGLVSCAPGCRMKPRACRALSALRYHEECAMKTLMGAAVVAGLLALAGPPAIGPAAAASPKAGIEPLDTSKATDFSARRRYRHHYRYGYVPYYYARPTYYRPYPYYTPAPFTFGFGFGPWW